MSEDGKVTWVVVDKEGKPRALVHAVRWYDVREWARSNVSVFDAFDLHEADLGGNGTGEVSTLIHAGVREVWIDHVSRSWGVEKVTAEKQHV